MRILTIIISFLVSAMTSAQTEYPTNKGNEIVKELDLFATKNKLSKHEGEFYAFDIKVIKVEKAFLDKPYFLGEFETGEQIWIASLLKSDFIIENRTLRVLGSLAKVQGDDSFAKKYHSKPYHILMFALLDLETKKAATFEAGMFQAEEWRDGKIPEDLER